jgi:hypothetical protein
MRILLEPELMVAALWEGHPRHRVARSFVLQPAEYGSSQASFARVYAYLTSLDVQPPFAPSLVLAVMRDVLQPVRVLGLAPPDHEFALSLAERLGAAGDLIDRILNLRAGANWGAAEVATLDPIPLSPFASELGIRVREV